MKKILLPILFAIVVPTTFSCSALRGYTLTEADAAAAIRQMLEFGTRDGLKGAFSKETIMTTIFPKEVARVLNTLNQLGLTNEVDRFTTTLGTAAEQTAEKSVPIFVDGIRRMNLRDAMSIVKNGGTAGTDYLRSAVGSELRTSIKPVMQSALNEYKLNEQWAKIMQPVKGLLGERFNLDLSNLMAGMVSEAMFRKIEEKERQVRNDANERTTQLLQKVFSRSWN